MRVTTISHPHAQLLKRNEKLEELWALDNSLRDMHAGDWRNDVELASTLREMADDREDLAREITQMGAAPWCFNIGRDNAWLVQARTKCPSVELVEGQ